MTYIDATVIIAAVTVGFFLGILTAILFRNLNKKAELGLVEKVAQESTSTFQNTLSQITDNLKANFAEMSMSALSSSNTELMKLAKSQLSSERELTVKEVQSQKSLIDNQLSYLNKELEKVRGLIKDLEKDRENKFSELSSTITHTNKQTRDLLETTNQLNKILGSSQERGQWGERVAEDILQVAGFIEHVNYTKQSQATKSQTRPDFSFLLPGGRHLNMDVKFPLDNYRYLVNAEVPSEKEKYQKLFIRDIKLKIKEVTTRDYINPTEDSIDLVILFIPNEQIFNFILANEPTLVDDAMKKKVVCCSPLSLFPILAVIRQAVDQFSLDKQSNVILQQLGLFKKNWQKFTLGFEKIGKKVSELHKEYDALATVRTRQLEKPLDKLDDLRIEKEIDLED